VEEWLSYVPTGGAVSVLTAVAWMIYTGRLVPRSVMEERIEQYKEAAEFNRATAERKDQLLTQVQLESAKTLERMILGIRQQVEDQE
jgi:hypothetical protein